MPPLGLLRKLEFLALHFLPRAEQLSLEQRRNAVNEKETKKEKVKKTKEEKEDKRKRKEEKKLLRKQSEDSSSCISPAPPSVPEASKLVSSPPSILKEDKAKAEERSGALVRNKSLKRVSFEEHLDIIEDKERTAEAEDLVGEGEEELPALEEVGGAGEGPARAPTPPGER